MKNSIILILLALALPALAGADQDLRKKCHELQQAAADARARYIADDLARQEQTVLQPVPSLNDLSCIDSFTAGVDVSKYDPVSVVSMLEQQAKREL